MSDLLYGAVLPESSVLPGSDEPGQNSAKSFPPDPSHFVCQVSPPAAPACHAAPAASFPYKYCAGHASPDGTPAPPAVPAPTNRTDCTAGTRIAVDTAPARSLAAAAGL